MQEGKPFWTLPKRPPKCLDFDARDPLHEAFIISAASLRAREFGIPVPMWTTETRAAAALQAAAVMIYCCIHSG